jgi:hypothetical protein
MPLSSIFSSPSQGEGEEGSEVTILEPPALTKGSIRYKLVLEQKFSIKHQ